MHFTHAHTKNLNLSFKIVVNHIPILLCGGHMKQFFYLFLSSFQNAFIKWIANIFRAKCIYFFGTPCLYVMNTICPCPCDGANNLQGPPAKSLKEIHSRFLIAHCQWICKFMTVWNIFLSRKLQHLIHN